MRYSVNVNLTRRAWDHEGSMPSSSSSGVQGGVLSGRRDDGDGPGESVVSLPPRSVVEMRSGARGFVSAGAGFRLESLSLKIR